MERIATIYRKIRNWWFERTRDGVEPVAWLAPTERTWAVFETDDKTSEEIPLLVHVWEVRKDTERGCTLLLVQGLVHNEDPCIKEDGTPDLSRPTYPYLSPVCDMKDFGLLFRSYRVG